MTSRHSRAARLAAPVIGDARAARVRHEAIHDERLSVGAVVEAAEGPPAQGVVPGDVAAALREHGQDVLADVGGPNRVQQDHHAHAAAGALRERARERQADLSRPVDVGLDGDRRARSGDVVEHARVERVAVVQDLHAVAGEERRRRGAGHRRQELR
ncbi:MAG: hypothetical protein R2745_08240 [Vicinamibacterales bacterium]